MNTKKGNGMKCRMNLTLLAGLAAVAVPASLARADIALPDPGSVGPYRVVFVTSADPPADATVTMPELNAWVTGLAQATGAVDDGGALGTTWSVVGATSAVNVFENTDTEPGVDPDHPIYLVDGAKFADDYTDFWAVAVGSPHLNINELGGTGGGAGSWAHTGLEAGPVTSANALDTPFVDGVSGISHGGLDAGYNPWYGNGDTWAGGIDNGALFAISGVIGGASTSFPLTITPNGANYDFTWESQDGKLYDLVSDTDLSMPRAEWPVYMGHADIEGSAPSNTLESVPGDGTKRFFAVIEKDLPPVTAFSEDFDGDEITAPNLPTDWTTDANTPADTGTTQWQLGAPSAVGPADANSPANCVGTNLDADYGFDTDIWLRTPSIDLTAYTEGTLQFKQFRDIEDLQGGGIVDFDFGSIRILAADDLAELAVLETAVEGADTDWVDYSKALPEEAFDEAIIIEFRFESDDEENQAGWYIDDVVVVTVPGS